MITSSSDPYVAWLGGVSNTELAELLRHRPDVVVPTPPTLHALATRLRLRASIVRALHQLNALDLGIMEVAADLGAELRSIDPNTLIGAVINRCAKRDDNVLAPAVAAGITRLGSFGIVYRTADGVRLLADATAALPGTLSILPPRPLAETARLIEELDPAQYRLLTSLATSGGVGHSRDANPSADPTLPVPSLIAAGLLDVIDGYHVRLPRPVSGLLRGRPFSVPSLVDPALSIDAPTAAATAVQRIDAAGAAQGLEMTRRIAALIDVLGTHPVALNKDHTVPARTSTSVAKRLSTTAADVDMLISLAASADLVTTGLTAHVPDPLDPDANYLAPTVAADEWLAEDWAHRWARVLNGWLTSPHAYFRGGRLLGDDKHSDSLLRLRRLILERYTHLPAGTPLDDHEVSRHLAFHAPLVAATTTEDDIVALVAEAREVGVLAHDAATTVARELLDSRDIVATAAAHIPPEVDQFIVQADMTVMAPGPLPYELQRQMDLVADLEAPGLAAMYRITEASLRRALDAGLTASAINEFFTSHCLGHVPQTVSYLVDDVARRHGGVRGGVATSYLRCTDEALLAEIMASPAAVDAQLRLLAPTVVLSPLPLARVLTILRTYRFTPVAENDNGETVDMISEPARAYGRVRHVTPPPSDINEGRITAAVVALRASANTTPDAPPAVTQWDSARSTFAQPPSASPVAMLQAAARSRRAVVITAVDKSGRRMDATVVPVTVTGGQVDALDESTGTIRRFLLHRITQVTLT